MPKAEIHPMKTVVCIASHERHQPLSIVLAALPAHWHAVVVLSLHEDPEPLLQRPNTHVYLFPNDPLGAKWQHAVDMGMCLQPDLLLITGSDDVLEVDPVLLEASMQHYDMAGLRSFTAYDGTQYYRCAYKAHVRMPIGGGRVYRGDLLKRMRGQLFDRSKNKHLDEFGWHNAVRHGARTLVADEIPGLAVIAMKGPWPCKNPMDKYLRGKNLDVILIDNVRHSVHHKF
jgi:hypothetical protein